MYTLGTPGLLIAVEGIDAAGSSSLVGNLVRLMDKRGLKTFATKEPTDNLIGGLIRGALTHEWNPSPRTLQQLFVADRSHHLDRMILLTLNKGHHVVSDRYAWSTLAFGSINVEMIELERMNDSYPRADLTFLVDAVVETTQSRIDQRDHKELFEKKSSQEIVRENYLEISRRHPQGVTVMDGRRSQEELAQQALEVVLNHPLVKEGKRPLPPTIDPGLDCLVGHPDWEKIYHGWIDPHKQEKDTVR